MNPFKMAKVVLEWQNFAKSGHTVTVSPIQCDQMLKLKVVKIFQ